jgi:hypothetical protein
VISRALAFAAALTVSGTMVFADTAQEAPQRYVAPGGVFSIDMSETHLFHLGKVSSSADVVMVDFPYLSTSGLAMSVSRTVEWLRIDKPVDPMSYDSQATGLVSGYLEGRYGAGQFTVADRGKFRDRDGRQVYVFAATGNLAQMPAQWQGTVLFFDTGVALVSSVIAQPTNYRFAPKGGIQERSAVDWALTLRPGL